MNKVLFISPTTYSIPVTTDIQKKFKTLVKKYHPDKNRGSKKYEDILKKITLAYSQLKVSMRK